MNRWTAEEGVPSPLGVTWVEDGQAVNFALYSKHATDVTLLLYSQHDTKNPAMQCPLNYLTHKSGCVWHCRLPASRLQSLLYYAYRVDGPDDPVHGYRFDPEEILLVPFAKPLLQSRPVRKEWRPRLSALRRPWRETLQSAALDHLGDSKMVGRSLVMTRNIGPSRSC